MSCHDAPNCVESCEHDDLDTAVDFSDLDVTFSAPFYTGVFLSSRELQGTYESHQNIVIGEMEEKLEWGWSSPSNVPEFWDRTVSPSYFIGAKINDSRSVLVREISDSIGCSSLDNNCCFEYNSSNVHINIKFFEFGFGSVGIRLKGVSGSKAAVSSGEDLRKFSGNCEKVIRPILNFIASSATREYRKCVPCCIKNSDIWDIDNFAGLEASEDICRAGEVQEISLVVALEKGCCEKFKKHKSELKKVFGYFSKNLHKAPYNAAYRLFTDGKSITIALGSQKVDRELEYLLYATEMIATSFAIEKYFENFFYSYYNYISSEYELIESKDNIQWKNIWNFKNLIEKFLDVQSMYFQIKDFVLKNILTSNHTVYMSELYTIHPKMNSRVNIFSVTDENMKQLEKQFEQIKFSATKYFTVSSTILSIGISLAVVSLSISPALIGSDLDFWRVILIPSVSVATILFAILPITSPRLGSRKLYYLCKLQKKKYRKMFKDQKKKNQDKKNCVCKVKGCHRCLGDEWHHRVFYLKENLCFRCGKAHEIKNEAKNEFDQASICRKCQEDEWYRRKFYREENLMPPMSKNS